MLRVLMKKSRLEQMANISGRKMEILKRNQKDVVGVNEIEDIYLIESTQAEREREQKQNRVLKTGDNFKKCNIHGIPRIKESIASEETFEIIQLIILKVNRHQTIYPGSPENTKHDKYQKAIPKHIINWNENS